MYTFLRGISCFLTQLLYLSRQSSRRGGGGGGGVKIRKPRVASATRATWADKNLIMLCAECLRPLAAQPRTLQLPSAARPRPAGGDWRPASIITLSVSHLSYRPISTETFDPPGGFFACVYLIIASWRRLLTGPSAAFLFTSPLPSPPRFGGILWHGSLLIG